MSSEAVHTKAYTVYDSISGNGDIVFANHHNTAKKMGVNLLDSEYEYIEVTRKPEYDQYYELGCVPPLTLIGDGWWFSCYDCGRRIYADMDADEEDNYGVGVENAVQRGRQVFCCQQCMDDFDKDKADREGKFVEFKEKVVSLRPDLTFKEFTRGGNYITMTATFTFPGCQYGGSVRDQDGTGELTWYIANGDKPAWDEYEKSYEESVTDNHLDNNDLEMQKFQEDFLISIQQMKGKQWQT